MSSFGVLLPTFFFSASSPFFFFFFPWDASRNPIQKRARKSRRNSFRPPVGAVAAAVVQNAGVQSQLLPGPAPFPGVSPCRRLIDAAAAVTGPIEGCGPREFYYRSGCRAAPSGPPRRHFRPSSLIVFLSSRRAVCRPHARPRRGETSVCVFPSFPPARTARGGAGGRGDRAQNEEKKKGALRNV